MTVGQLAGGRP